MSRAEDTDFVSLLEFATRAYTEADGADRIEFQWDRRKRAYVVFVNGVGATGKNARAAFLKALRKYSEIVGE